MLIAEASNSDWAYSSAYGFSTITGSSAVKKNLFWESLAFWIFSSIIFCLLASA
jgi:hypothetical protein